MRRHPSCIHKQYAVSCDEYEVMVAAADGSCQMCRKPTATLVIDHDHALGPWAVRGLLCTSCNVTLGRIEHGRKGMTPLAGGYLDTPWHQAHGWGEGRRVGLREQVECTACGRMVGAMLNGAPYPHRAERMSEANCTGAALKKEKLRRPKVTHSPKTSPGGPTLQPWFYRPIIEAAKVPVQHPVCMSDDRQCLCGHSGLHHEVSRQCIVAGDWWDCPCVSYEPTYLGERC